MLTRKQLREFYPEKVPLHILELDYVQSIVLKGIYTRGDGLVFKGGTCLRKAFGLNRYSEDLDFNLISGEPRKTLEGGLIGLKAAGIISRLSQFEERKSVYLATIRYKGPLFTGSELSEGVMQVEISKREPVNEPEWITVISQLPDVGTYSLLSMSPEEILAEKLRTLVQRSKARDLYDIWFLLNKGVKLHHPTLDLKFEEAGIAHKTVSKILEEYDITDREWERDMKNLMARVPKRTSVLDYVGEKLGLGMIQ